MQVDLALPVTREMRGQDIPSSASSTRTLLDSRVHFLKVCLAGEADGLRVLGAMGVLGEADTRSMMGISVARRVEVFEALFLVVDIARLPKRVGCRGCKNDAGCK